MRLWLVVCAAPVSENPATVGMRESIARPRASRILLRKDS